MVFDSFEFKAVSYKVKSLLIEALIFFFGGGRGEGRGENSLSSEISCKHASPYMKW